MEAAQYERNNLELQHIARLIEQQTFPPENTFSHFTIKLRINKVVVIHGEK
jgi:hypothetical protein